MMETEHIEWKPADGVVNLGGNAGIRLTYWDGDEGLADPQIIVYQEDKEVCVVGIPRLRVCRRTAGAKSFEQRMAEAAERQAAAMERIAAVAEWQQKWRDWNGEDISSDMLRDAGIAPGLHR